MWEEFRSLALPVPGERFPPELIEDTQTASPSPAGVITEPTFSAMRGELSRLYEVNENTVVLFCTT